MDGPTILTAIEAFVALLGVAAIVAIVARPLRLPYTVALVLVGLSAGIGRPIVLPGPEPIVAPEIVLVVLLPGLVFEAGYRLDLGLLRRSLAPLLFLAMPGVLISASFVAVLLHAGTGLRLDLAFIVGAMVSATDPAAVISTFRRLPVPRTLATVVEGESLLNDGTGLVVFALAVGALTTPITAGGALLTFVGTVIISGAIGVAAGICRGAADGAGRRPPDRADDLGRARLRDLPPGRCRPRVGDHRHRPGRDRARQLRSAIRR